MYSCSNAKEIPVADDKSLSIDCCLVILNFKQNKDHQKRTCCYTQHFHTIYLLVVVKIPRTLGAVNVAICGLQKFDYLCKGIVINSI